MMWREVVGFIRQKRKILEDIKFFISRYKDYIIFKKISIDAPLITRLSMLLKSITLSLAPSDGIEKILLYLRQYPDTEKDVAYLERLNTFFNEEFQHLNKYYIYITHPSLRLPEELAEKRNNLLIRIEELLGHLKDNFGEIKESWERFFDAFYESEIFGLKRGLEGNSDIATLRKIGSIVTSITFPYEWWQIKKELDKLPERCMADVDNELFSCPVCKCGYRIGDIPPSIEADFSSYGKSGLMNFIKTLQLPENREKLDSFIIGSAEAGMQDIAKRIHTIVTLDLSKADYSLLPTFLTDQVLNAVEKALRGRWEIKELEVEEFVEKIKGRRFRYIELRDILMKWLGDNEESIIHVLDRSSSRESVIKEEFAKYGHQGERIYIDLSASAIYCKRVEDLESALREARLLHHLDTFNMSSYKTDELFNFLKTEKLELLKKKLRTEIYFRLKDKTITQELLNITDDESLKDLLEISKILSKTGHLKGASIFTDMIAPAEYLFWKLTYKAQNRDVIDEAVIESLQQSIKDITTIYEKDKYKYEGAKDIDYIKDALKDVVVILDGLRYDLWYMLRGIMEKEGAGT